MTHEFGRTYLIISHARTSWPHLIHVNSNPQVPYRAMAAERIPNEIWVYVFELATVDDTHREVLSTSLDNSSWFKTIFGVWSLQSPEELSITAQKKRYRTIKVTRVSCT